MRLLIAAGGTAGHVNPAIAIARAVKARAKDAEILFIGTLRGLEAELVPREGFDIEFINVRGFKRSLTPENAVIACKAAAGMLKAARIAGRFKPDAVVGCGGYASGPVVLYAALRGIPTLVHEQNVFPGLTTRLLSRFVDTVAISFKETCRYLPRKNNILLTGNPVRQQLLKRDYHRSRLELGLDSRPVILAFGGSLGAAAINSAIMKALPYVKDRAQVIWATGKTRYNEIKSMVAANGIDESDGIRVMPYIYNMDLAMAASDLVICRAGAITLSELCALGKPSILIPSPNVTHNHQEYNARALEKNGAAVVLLESALTPQSLGREIKGLLMDKQRLARMAANAKKMGITDADKKLCDRLFELVSDKKAKKHKI